MREEARQAVTANANAVRLLDYLFEQPILNVRIAERYLGCTYVTAASAIEFLVQKNILHEATGGKRNRIFRFGALLDLFRRQLPALDGSTPLPSKEKRRAVAADE